MTSLRQNAVTASETPSLSVVHLVTTLNIGGLEKVVLDLVRCRRSLGGASHVICVEEDGTLAPIFAGMGVGVETLGRPGDTLIGRVTRLVRRLQELRPDVLHTHNPGPHLHGALAARLARVPALVHTKHGRNHPGRAWRVLLNRLAASMTDCLVAVSEDAARVAIDVEKVPAQKVRVVHNGIDIDRFAFRPARRASEAFRAITVARLDPVKDQVTLLKAARIVANTHPDFCLDIVGDGPSRGELEQLARQLDLSAHVAFHGFKGDVAPLLADTDVFVLSSISEGIPLTLLEAMATGLPGIATDVGGNREVIVPEETGYLVPPSSPERLAEAILDLRGNRAKLESMGIASRRRVESGFSLRAVVAEYEGIYRQCVAGRIRSAGHGKSGE